MFSPLAQRLAARLGISSGRSHIASKPSILSQTRRSFVTTSPRTFPAAAAKPTTKKPATKKPAVKKLVAKATKAKATAPKTVAAKKPTATKAKPKRRVAAKKPAAKKPTRTPLAKSDMPPKNPPNSYFIFFSKYIKGLSEAHKPKTVNEVAKCAQDASSMWRSLSEAEKQPFRDEEAELRKAYHVERETWFANTSQKVVAEINRRRVAKGKKRIHKITEPSDRKPPSSFFRFLGEFRNSPEAQSIREGESGRAAVLAVAKAAGEGWTALSDSEKSTYIDAANKEMAEWKIKNSS